MQQFIKKNELILVWLIFLLGAYLRLIHLDYPLGLHGDEAWTGLEARRILTTGPIGIWSPGALGQPAGPFYWTALMFKLFGESLFTLRFSFAILQVLVLPFFYLIVKNLFNRNSALIAFLLFVCARIPLHFSHIAYSLFLIPFLPAVYFFLQAIQTNKRRYFILSGIFLGIGPNFYPGLRILPILFLLFLIKKSFSTGFLSTYWKNILVLVITGVLFFLPLGIYGMQHPEDFMTRTHMVSIYSKDGLIHENMPNFYASLLNNLKKNLFMFTYSGDTDFQDNIYAWPLLDIVSAVFFFLGFIASFIYKKSHAKEDGRVFLLLWFFLFLSGSILTIDAPNFRRIQPAIAAINIYIALGIAFLYQKIVALLPKSRILMLIIFAAIITGICSYNVSVYFFKQAIDWETKFIFAYPLVKVAEYIHTAPRPDYVYFYSGRWSYHYEPLRFLSNDIPGEDRSLEFGLFSLKNSHPDQNVVYLFLPDYENSFIKLQQDCPLGKIFTKKDTDGQPIFFAYIIPKFTCR